MLTGSYYAFYHKIYRKMKLLAANCNLTIRDITFHPRLMQAEMNTSTSFSCVLQGSKE